MKGESHYNLLVALFNWLADFKVRCRVTRSSTTAGSAKVEISPKLSVSSAATLRSILRIILPDRVLGKLGQIYSILRKMINIMIMKFQAPALISTCITSGIA